MIFAGGGAARIYFPCFSSWQETFFLFQLWFTLRIYIPSPHFIIKTRFGHELDFSQYPKCQYFLFGPAVEARVNESFIFSTKSQREHPISAEICQLSSPFPSTGHNTSLKFNTQVCYFISPLSAPLFTLCFHSVAIQVIRLTKHFAAAAAATAP